MRGAEARGLKDFAMSMQEAKDLHADITRLLIDLQTLRESMNKTAENEPIQVEITGGTF